MNRTAVLIFAIICCAAVALSQQQQQQQQGRISTFAYLLRRSTTPVPRARLTNGSSSRQSQPARLANRASAASVPTVIAPSNDAQLSSAVADLAFAIGQHSAADLSVASDIFSPVSIMAVLNLLLLGAEGTTYQELLGALRVGNIPMKEYHRRAAGMTKNLLAEKPLELDQLAWKGASCVVYEYEDEEEEEEQLPVKSKSKELRIANAIFAQNKLPINSKFVSLANQLYGANTQSVNFYDSFTAASLINKWVTQATNGRIREVTNGQFSADTNMIIASSLYFKATWQTEFTAYATRPRDFFPDGSGRGGSFKVDMMTLSECLPYYFDKASGVRMVGLPYSDNATTMYVLMPQSSSRSKVRDLQQKLSAKSIDAMIARMTRHTTTINLPRMQLASSTNLEKSFRRLGIKSLFNAQQSNLNGMLDASVRGKIPLFVSQITHKVNLSVDEHGTEGAAVTVTLVDRSSSQAYLNANEPFLIYVRHDPTRLPLFYGAVFDPRG